MSSRTISVRRKIVWSELKRILTWRKMTVPVCFPTASTTLTDAIAGGGGISTMTGLAFSNPTTV